MKKQRAKEKIQGEKERRKKRQKYLGCATAACVCHCTTPDHVRVRELFQQRYFSEGSWRNALVVHSRHPHLFQRDGMIVLVAVHRLEHGSIHSCRRSHTTNAFAPPRTASALWMQGPGARRCAPSPILPMTWYRLASFSMWALVLSPPRGGTRGGGPRRKIAKRSKDQDLYPFNSIRSPM